MAAFDRSSKWLIQHHGDALLRLAGIRGIVSWRALHAELVQPGQLPDGLLEAHLAGEPEPDLFVVEIATYPEQRLIEQLHRDALLVFLNKRIAPEVLALILHPKGAMRPADSVVVSSRRGWTQLAARWRIIELWTLPAEELLATNDPGVMPWVPLARSADPPPTVLQKCREVIETVSSEEERSNLLAVTQVLAQLRYNDTQLLAILGGRNTMIESPLLQELKEEWTAEARAEARAEAILRVLEDRFEHVSTALRETVQSVRDEARLDHLLTAAVRCPNLSAFEAQLRS